MTLLPDPPEETVEATVPTPPAADVDAGSEPPVAVPLTCAAVALSTAAAAWMLAGIFEGLLPKLVAFVAALVGPAVVLVSYRTARPAVVQYLALPIAVVGGALLVLPGATGGSANLPSLVVEAIRSGGLSQPPVPFEPGWRFLVVVLLVLLGTGAAAIATALDRPKLGIAVSLPVVVAGSLVQPPSSAVLACIVAIVLMVGALTLASGAALAQEGSSSGAFEVRRLLRGLGGLVALAVALVTLSQAGFLFPGEAKERVIPPKRPEAQPPLSDRVLFTVASTDPGPWRFGVVDVYDERAWLLPPLDRSRFVDVPDSGDLAEALAGREERPEDGPAAIPAAPTDAKKARTITFEVGDLPGRVLPTIEGQVLVKERGVDVELDPRTQTLRSADGRVAKGSSYTVTAPMPPTAAALAGAPETAPAALAPYLEAPDPPSDVVALIALAPKRPFERLQYVRNAFYKKVIVAGKGEPVDVPPSRVSEMLNGAEASPYEITAGEALLARWAGVPSRIGYGFYSGTKTSDGKGFEIHPKHGATWLEAYFPGPGWITIVGRPPQAKASTSLDDKNKDPLLRASADLALIVHVPIELENLRQLYDTIRFYVLVSLPWVLLAVLALVFYPGLLKVGRRWRRRRWGRSTGLEARVLVAYADLRDRLRDVNAPLPTATPLEFVSAVEFDEEHWELAWLTSRALWGDLRRDVRLEDAEAAEDLARSVTQRVLRAQRVVPRLLGVAARTSLREPYTLDVPNLWPSGERWRRVRSLPRRVPRQIVGLLPRRMARGTAVLVLVLVAVTTLGACGSGQRAVPPGLPEQLVPAAVGPFRLQREPKAEAAFVKAGDAALVKNGQVFSVRRGGEVLASFQAAAFKPERNTNRRKIQEGLRKSLGSGNFVQQRIGRDTIYVLQQSEQRILLWFPPGGGYYLMLDAKQGFGEADRLFTAILAFQRGDSADLSPDDALVDIRRGGD